MLRNERRFLEKDELIKRVPFIAYKVTDSNGNCQPDKNKSAIKYEVGKEYKEDKIKICTCGIHACLNLSDCFNYYSFDSSNKVFEVTILGNFETHDDDSKVCTDHIRIERELTWHEVLKLCNSGNRNSGNSNSGDWNSGNRNSGDWNSGNENSGDRNSGNRNSGDWNSGNRNSGNENSGDRNSGNENSGDRNSGNRNSGDWNSGNENSGIFNSKEINIFCFNKLSDIKFQDWINHPAYNICYKFDLCSFISHDLMTEEEKENHQEYKTIGGYLKKLEYKNACKIWWDKLNNDEKKIMQTLPNFDADVFEEITGIKI